MKILLISLLIAIIQAAEVKKTTKAPEPEKYCKGNSKECPKVVAYWKIPKENDPSTRKFKFNFKHLFSLFTKIPVVILFTCLGSCLLYCLIAFCYARNTEDDDGYTLAKIAVNSWKAKAIAPEFASSAGGKPN